MVLHPKQSLSPLVAFFLLLCPPLFAKAERPTTPELNYPQLYGQHFRITTVEQPGYVDIEEDVSTGELTYSGYLIDILRSVSREDRGNFTYDLFPPSGFGSLCIGKLPMEDYNNSLDSTFINNPQAYSKAFRTQYKCAESDVNDRPLSAYSTTMYWGLFYVTIKRLAASKFTVPFSPPTVGTLGMLGTATGIRSIEELADQHSHRPVCAFEATAYIENLATSFPSLQVVPITYSKSEIQRVMSDGTCDIIIGAYAELQNMVKRFHEEGKCIFNEMPIGMIGRPLSYGFNHFAFGVRPDLPDEVLATINFWMNALMTCFPENPDSLCSEQMGGGSFSEMFKDISGTGTECGYVLFPPPESNNLGPGVIAAIVISPVVLVLALAMVYHMHQLKKQEKRMKKRFIQQLARNIEIGENARDIPADKLTEAFKHIGGETGMISKQDLSKWLNDIHMDFMSEKDFERLWHSLDMEGRGMVDAIDFINFLTQCAPQFKEVHDEFSALPKTERMKLATRRLSNISEHGEDGVAAQERRNNRRSRQMVHINASDILRSSGVSNRSSGVSNNSSSGGRSN